MTTSMSRNELLKALSEVEVYPLFSSLNKARLEEKTFEEWLRSIPKEILEDYSEHTIFKKKKRTKEEEIRDQDYMVTVVTLHAIAHDNAGMAEDEVPKSMQIFQQVICALSINHDTGEEWGMPDFSVINIKAGTWNNFLDVTLQANPDVKFVDKSDKS